MCIILVRRRQSSQKDNPCKDRKHPCTAFLSLYFRYFLASEGLSLPSSLSCLGTRYFRVHWWELPAHLSWPVIQPRRKFQPRKSSSFSVLCGPPCTQPHPRRNVFLQSEHFQSGCSVMLILDGIHSRPPEPTIPITRLMCHPAFLCCLYDLTCCSHRYIISSFSLPSICLLLHPLRPLHHPPTHSPRLLPPLSASAKSWKVSKTRATSSLENSQ